MKKNRITILVDDTTKEQIQSRVEELGMDMSTYIRMLIKKDIREDK